VRTVVKRMLSAIFTGCAGTNRNFGITLFRILHRSFNGVYDHWRGTQRGRYCLTFRMLSADAELTQRSGLTWREFRMNPDLEFRRAFECLFIARETM
jgi:hypothetical protein